MTAPLLSGINLKVAKKMEDGRISTPRSQNSGAHVYLFFNFIIHLVFNKIFRSVYNSWNWARIESKFLKNEDSWIYLELSE